jgi:hypothetical protein
MPDPWHQVLPALLREGEGAADGFAAVYFSGSFSLLPGACGPIPVA